jgi:hypothetical protein
VEGLVAQGLSWREVKVVVVKVIAVVKANKGAAGCLIGWFD